MTCKCGLVKRAVFGFKDEKAVCCKRCKEEGMLNLQNRKKCGFEKCSSYPTFNILGEKQGLYCSKHKLENMINVIVKEKQVCIFKGCNTIPQYSFLGEKKGLYCFEHKLESMVNVKEKQVCIFRGCNTQPSYNLIGENNDLCCLKHKFESMITVLEKLDEFYNNA